MCFLPASVRRPASPGAHLVFDDQRDRVAAFVPHLVGRCRAFFRVLDQEAVTDAKARHALRHRTRVRVDEDAKIRGMTPVGALKVSALR